MDVLYECTTGDHRGMRYLPDPQHMSAKYDNTDGRLRGRKLQARRLRVWKANPYCACGCGRITNYPDGFQLDHKVPLYKGGEDTDENSQVLAIPCHDKKTMKDMGYRERLEFDKEGRVKW